MRCVARGGVWFFSSHLPEALFGNGHKVLAVDNISSRKYSNIAHQNRHSDFALLSDEICDLTQRQLRDVELACHCFSIRSRIDGGDSLCVLHASVVKSSRELQRHSPHLTGLAGFSG